MDNAIRLLATSASEPEALQADVRQKIATVAETRVPRFGVPVPVFQSSSLSRPFYLILSESFGRNRRMMNPLLATGKMTSKAILRLICADVYPISTSLVLCEVRRSGRVSLWITEITGEWLGTTGLHNKRWWG